MALKNVRETSFMNPVKSVVALPDHYVNITGFVATSAIPQEYKDLGYIPAGALLDITDRGAVTIVDGTVASSEFNAVNFNNADIYEDGANVACLVHGFVRGGALLKFKKEVVTNSNSLIMVL